MRIFNQGFLDTAGMWTSALCAAHCLVVPVIVSISAFSGFIFLEKPALENTILLISAVLGTSSLFPSYFRHHKRLTAIIVLMVGFILIGLSPFLVNVNESVITSSGAALVASAHFINFTLCKKHHNKQT